MVKEIVANIDLEAILKHFNDVIYYLNNGRTLYLKTLEVQVTGLNHETYDLLPDEFINNCIVKENKTLAQHYENSIRITPYDGVGPQQTAALLYNYQDDIRMQALIWLAAATRDKSKAGELEAHWKPLRMSIVELSHICYAKFEEYEIAYWTPAMKHTYPISVHDHIFLANLMYPKSIKDLVTLFALEVNLNISTYTVIKFVPK